MFDEVSIQVTKWIYLHTHILSLKYVMLLMSFFKVLRISIYTPILQEDLQFYSKKADTKLLGFVDLGKEAQTLHDMKHGK